MLEIPALAAAVAGLCVLLLLGNARWHVAEVVAGILFGVAMLLKLVPVILLAVAALILWLRYRESPHTIKRTFLSLAILGASLAVTFLVLDVVIDGGAYLANFQQSWVSHFGAAKTSEYGSAKDYPFAWSVLLNNWDTSIPAAVGIAVAIRQARQLPLALVPVGWLALSFLVFGIHRPWWPYYYIHTAVPLCLCAALGIRAVSRDVLRRVPFSGKAFIDGVQRLRTEKGTPLPRILRFLAAAGLAVCGLCAAGWMGGRVYLQIESVRHAHQTYSTLVLSEIERFKPSVDWIYADKLVYSFHSGIPVPPQLAVVPLKRLWSGEMTSARLADEVNKYQPGLIVLNNDGREMPFQELLDRDYRLVYEDTEDRLYAHRGLKAKP